MISFPQSLILSSSRSRMFAFWLSRSLAVSHSRILAFSQSRILAFSRSRSLVFLQSRTLELSHSRNLALSHARALRSLTLTLSLSLSLSHLQVLFSPNDISTDRTSEATINVTNSGFEHLQLRQHVSVRFPLVFLSPFIVRLSM